MAASAVPLSTVPPSLDQRVWAGLLRMQRYWPENYSLVDYDAYRQDPNQETRPVPRIHRATLPEGTDLPAMMFRVATQVSGDGFDQSPDLWRYEFAIYDRADSAVLAASRELLTALSPITARLDSIEDVYIDAGEGAYARIVHLWIR